MQYIVRQRIRVIIMLIGLCEQKQMIVRTIWLGPDDIPSHIPSIGLQSEGQSPWNADFSFGPGYGIHNSHPKGSTIPKHAAQFSEYLNKLGDMLLIGRFHSNPSVYPRTSTHPFPAGWSGDAAMDALVWHGAQYL